MEEHETLEGEEQEVEAWEKQLKVPERVVASHGEQ